MKKIILLITAALLILSGCTNKKDVKEEGKLHIVTTLFPQYDIVKQIAGDKATVSLLLPPGVEAHSYEPTPQDMVILNDSDLFIYTSDHLESYAASMVKSLDNSEMSVINLQDALNIEGDDHDHDEEEDHEGHDHDHEDPHFWLDPTVMIDAALIINQSLQDLDPENKTYYQDNTEILIKNLEQLDADFKTMFEEADNDTIVFAGHFAFDYFAKRYGMNYITPFESFSANAEASTKRVSELIDFIKVNKIEVVYFEELVDPKLANMLASETGAKTLMLHAAHNVSKEELDKGVTYLDIMYQNLENLKEGLSHE